MKGIAWLKGELPHLLMPSWTPKVSKLNIMVKKGALMVGKKTHGRKRHIGVDILGLLLHVFCHAANLSDTKQACTVMDRLIDKYPTIQAYAGDGGYRGTAVEYAKTLQNRRFDAVVGLTGPYVPMAKRWVVDRTFGWMSVSVILTPSFFRV